MDAQRNFYKLQSVIDYSIKLIMNAKLRVLMESNNEIVERE